MAKNRYICGGIDFVSGEQARSGARKYRRIERGKEAERFGTRPSGKGSVGMDVEMVGWQESVSVGFKRGWGDVSGGRMRQIRREATVFK